MCKRACACCEASPPVWWSSPGCLWSWLPASCAVWRFSVPVFVWPCQFHWAVPAGVPRHDFSGWRPADVVGVRKMRQFGDPIEEREDLRSEFPGDVAGRDESVFHGIMQQCGSGNHALDFHLEQERSVWNKVLWRHFFLAFMGFFHKVICFFNQVFILS